MHLNIKIISTLIIFIGIAIMLVGVFSQKRDHQRLLRDYQIELDMDTVIIYDNEREVGRFVSRFDSQYDSVFLKDNE